MSKITEQQLIESARRLKSKMLAEDFEDWGNWLGGLGGAAGGAKAGMAAGVAFTPPILPFVGPFAKPIGGAIGGIVGAVLGWIGGGTLGRKADIMAGSVKEWNDSLGLSDVTFVPNWSSPELNKPGYKNKAVKKDSNTGAWIFVDDERAVIKTALSKTDCFILDKMALIEMAKEGQEPNEGWKVGGKTVVGDHVWILKQYNPEKYKTLKAEQDTAAKTPTTPKAPAAPAAPATPTAPATPAAPAPLNKPAVDANGKKYEDGTEGTFQGKPVIVKNGQWQWSTQK